MSMDATNPSENGTDTSKATWTSCSGVMIQVPNTSHSKHLLSHTRHYSCAEEDCGYSAYLVKDLRRHITTVHRKAKIPCPVKGCAYSKDGRKGGISRRDALRRHLKSHGITFESTNQAKNNRSRSQDVSETSTIRTTRNYQAIDISQQDPG